ncbi:MAG: hypothetical protein WBA12_04700 [Catalinimonas sp.]
MKTTKHKNFVYEPRYYDPVAEELQQRTDEIRRELEAQRRTSLQDDSLGHATRISRGFSRQRQSRRQTSFLQVFLIFIICAFLVAYYEYANWAVLVPAAAVPIYLLARKYDLFES